MGVEPQFRNLTLEQEQLLLPFITSEYRNQIIGFEYVKSPNPDVDTNRLVIRYKDKDNHYSRLAIYYQKIAAEELALCLEVTHPNWRQAPKNPLRNMKSFFNDDRYLFEQSIGACTPYFHQYFINDRLENISLPRVYSLLVIEFYSHEYGMTALNIYGSLYLKEYLYHRIEITHSFRDDYI